MLLLLAACTARLPDPLPDQPHVDYAREHKAWTRELQLVVDLETRLMLEATLLTPELAEAQALTLARARMDEPTVYEARRKELLDRSEAAWSLVLTTTGTEQSDDTLSIDGSQDWTVLMEADGRRLTPLSLEEVREPTADDVLLYPQADRWARMWQITFEREIATELVLIVAGPRGNGSLTWELQ